MLSLKKNIGRRVNGLLYRITTTDVKIDGQAVSQPRIEWTGESDESADAVLASRPVGRPSDERDRASSWLNETLSKGPLSSIDVQARSKEAGIAYRTLQRVKDQPESGIIALRQSGKWYWKLNDGLDAPEIISPKAL
jgi:hypothetical protein